jgi:hypothetical protein
MAEARFDYSKLRTLHFVLEVFRNARAFAVTGSTYHRLTHGPDELHFDLFRRCYQFMVQLPETVVRFGDYPELDQKRGWELVESFETPDHYMGKFMKYKKIRILDLLFF